MVTEAGKANGQKFKETGPGALERKTAGHSMKAQTSTTNVLLVEL